MSFKEDYKNYPCLGIYKPIEKNGEYFSPFTKKKLIIDDSLSNRCYEQPSYTFYIDENDKVFWIGYYQASLGSSHTGTYGPFGYTEDFVHKSKCLDSDKQCLINQEGAKCTYGVWCDEFGNICGGQSCVGLGQGKCVNNKCELIK